MKALRSTLLFLFAVTLILSSGKAQASSQPYITGHQINFGTGNKYLSATDVSLPSPAGTLSFTRTYNSQSSTNSEVGYGWTGTFTEHLEVGTDTINLVQAGGRYIVFKNDGNGNWINQTGAQQIITANSTGYQLKESRGTIRQYDSSGYLTSITDLNNNTKSYSYLGGLPTSVSDNFGHTISFTYNNGKLTQVTSSIGTFTYSYVNDNLVTVTKPDSTTVQYIYDDPNDAHNLTGVIDESGTRILTVVYDTQDRVTSSAKAGDAEKVTITYPTFSSRVVTDSLGVQTTYQLDVLNGVVMVGSMTGPGCSSCGGNADTSYVYDGRLQITQATDANGVKTLYTYDGSGNQLTITKASGTPLANTTTSTYTTNNQVATITKPSVSSPGQQAVTSMTYDTHGNLLTKQQNGYSGTTAITATTTYAYNTYGQITSIVGPRTDVNNTMSFTYYPNDASQGNNRGNLQTVQDALGHTTTYSNYNAFGKATLITDPNGMKTSLVYDGNGRLTSTIAGYSTRNTMTTNYTYDPVGRLLKVSLPFNKFATPAGSREISYSYTPAGQVAQITDSMGNSIVYSYDGEGRRTKQEVHDPQNALKRYANYGYDSYGRLNQVTYPDSAQQTSEYDLVGNLIKTVNETALVTGYNYDALNRLSSMTEAGTTTAGYTYDTNGNITQVTDANGKITSFTYDDFGRRIQRTAPDTGQNNYTYDPAGNMTAMTDAKGQSATLKYDVLNRPIEQNYTGGSTLFVYDQGAYAIGHLSKITDSEGTDSFTYEGLSRISTGTRVIGGKSYGFTYQWDHITGDPSGLLYPSGLNVTYKRDPSGRITEIDVNGTPLVSSVSHLPFGPLTSATLGSAALTRNYDQRYNVSSIVTGSLNYAFTRDAGGNVTGITGIQAPTASSATVTYGYNPSNNQLSSAPPKTYIYDANGNAISDGTFTFTYDGLNRLIQVVKQGETVATYGYDSSNRRIRKTAGGVVTHYLYDLNNNLIAEALLDGTKVRDYIYLDNEPIAVKEYQNNPGIYYFVNDHLGTPQQLTSATGAVVWQASYLPFGKAQITTETVTNNLRFPGQYYDSETGLHYNWHRFYDPDTGRYVSADPIGLKGGLNLYAYVSGNPANRIDFNGLLDTGGLFTPGHNPTIVCDGNGGVKVSPVNNNICLTSCVVAHEEQHIKDVIAAQPGICKGKPEGTLVVMGREERRPYEVKGSTAEINCLMNKLSTLDKCDVCYKIIEDRIKEMEGYRDSFM